MIILPRVPAAVDTCRSYLGDEKLLTNVMLQDHWLSLMSTVTINLVFGVFSEQMY